MNLIIFLSPTESVFFQQTNTLTPTYAYLQLEVICVSLRKYDYGVGQNKLCQLD